MSWVPLFFGVVMIPLYKLAQLPRTQALRKTVKIFEDAERRLILKKRTPGEELHYLSELLGFWVSQVPDLPAKSLASIEETLKQGGSDTKEFNTILRSFNTVHHLLRRETGQYPSDWDFNCLEGLDPQKRRIFPGMEVYLEDIRSPFNVGAMFRTAESFGVEKLYLSPFCADPEHKRAQRTAMGCVSILSWLRMGDDPFYQENSNSFIPETAIFALETGGITMEDFPFPKQGIMIAGSEELGVSPKALEAADASLGRLSIPTYGAKSSLNVSVAFGIALQAWALRLVDKRTKNINT